MKVKFWGVRGSIPCPGPSTSKYGGNTSCIQVLGGEDIIVLDAGTGIRELGHELTAEKKPLRILAAAPLPLTVIIVLAVITEFRW